MHHLLTGVGDPTTAEIGSIKQYLMLALFSFKDLLL